MSTYSLVQPWNSSLLKLSSRTGAIIEHVLGWEVFSNGFRYQEKYEKFINSGDWLVTATNVAVATSDTWRVFSPGHELLFLDFDPLQNTDHAQYLLKHIYDNKGPLLLRFAFHLLQLHEPIESIEGDLPWVFWMDITTNTWTPEQICEAAYKAARDERYE